MEVSGRAVAPAARHIDPRHPGPADRGPARRWAGAGCSAWSTSAVVLAVAARLRRSRCARPLLDVDAVAGQRRRAHPADDVVAAAGIAPGDQLIDVDLARRGRRRRRAAVGRRGPACTGGSTAPCGRARSSGRRSRWSAQATAGPARRRRGPGRWARRRATPSLDRPALVAIDGLGRRRSSPASSVGDRGGRCRWRWPPASVRTLDAGRRAWSCEDGRLSCGWSTPGCTVCFGDAGQLEAKLLSLRTVLEQVDLDLRGHRSTSGRPAARC